jgi:hypothetical protein
MSVTCSSRASLTSGYSKRCSPATFMLIAEITTPSRAFTLGHSR